jgi:restriction system protein
MKEQIPDFQTLMLPLMELLRDNKEHPLPEVLDVMANKFALTEEELRIMVSSGQQTLFKNRVTWAISYLKNTWLNPKPLIKNILEAIM